VSVLHGRSTLTEHEIGQCSRRATTVKTPATGQTDSWQTDQTAESSDCRLLLLLLQEVMTHYLAR